MEDLYKVGFRPQAGEVIMLAGRSGSQKSGFALWWSQRMNLRTLYFSGDMTPYQASIRTAASAMGESNQEIEARLAAGGHRSAAVNDALGKVNTTFKFGELNWWKIDSAVLAHVELYNAWPEFVVFDNLMDFSGASDDYKAQMTEMQNITEFSHETGVTCLVLHHATDKGDRAASDPWGPPPRHEIKNGMSEKPSLILTCGLDPTSYDYKLAVVKQRMGAQDPTARNVTATLTADPVTTRFHQKIRHEKVRGLRSI